MYLLNNSKSGENFLKKAALASKWNCADWKDIIMVCWVSSPSLMNKKPEPEPSGKGAVSCLYSEITAPEYKVEKKGRGEGFIFMPFSNTELDKVKKTTLNDDHSNPTIKVAGIKAVFW